MPLSSSEICFNAWDDNANTLIDEGCGVRQGQLQVVVAWADAGADIDLYVRDPKGDVASALLATQSGLTHSGDCPSSEKSCHGQNFENVFLEESESLPGKYQVRIRLESMPTDSLSVKTSIGLRHPLKTRAFELEFFAEGQEQLIEFEVAEEKAKSPQQQTKPAKEKKVARESSKE